MRVVTGTDPAICSIDSLVQPLYGKYFWLGDCNVASDLRFKKFLI